MFKKNNLCIKLCCNNFKHHHNVIELPGLPGLLMVYYGLIIVYGSTWPEHGGSGLSTCLPDA